jgi:hypothetical protein
VTDNLSVSASLRGQTPSSNSIENSSQDSLQNSSTMSTEERLISMETPISRILAHADGLPEKGESAITNSSRTLGFDGNSNGGDTSVGITTKGSVEVSGSSFDYTTVGPEGYAEQVHELLTNIASTEAGETLLSEITKNGGNVVFSYGKGDAISRGNLFSRDTEIVFNPTHSQSITTTEGTRRAQPQFIVAHELHHAWKNTLNCWLGCSRPLILPGSVPRGLDAMEVHAVRYTNLIRTQAGVDYQRTHYNGVEIP